MPITVPKLLTHPLLWRFMGFGSSIVGFSCYAMSPSFQDLFGQWNPLKIVIYSVVSSLLSMLMLFVKTCMAHCYAMSPSFQDLFGQWNPLKIVIYSVVSSLLSMLMLFVKTCRGLVRSFLLRAHVGFLVLTLTSLYSFLEDRSEQGKEENGYGRMMNLTSTGAFALMAMSLSRQLELGFEVGIFNFFLGCFLVTVMKMNLKLAPVAALFCYLLMNIRSFSDFLLEMRGHGDTEPAHADDGNASNNDVEDSASDMEDFAGDMEAYEESMEMEDFTIDMEEWMV